jgi:DEAD/DEAH box helicase domain-containing protein
VPLEAIRSPAPAQLVAALCLHDQEGGGDADHFRRHWNGVLRRYNLLQFLPNAFCLATSGTHKHLYDDIESWVVPRPGPAGTAPGPGATPVADSLAFVDPELRSLVDALLRAGASMPVVGFELGDAEGAVVAEAELAWPTRQVALLLPGQAESAGVLGAQGWAVVSTDDLQEAERALRGLLTGGGHVAGN